MGLWDRMMAAKPSDDGLSFALYHLLTKYVFAYMKFFDQTLPKDHTDHKRVVGPLRNIIAASKRGRAHAHSGTFRDDDFSIQFNESTGWYMIAVADGAGSAQYAREGARIACDTAIGSPLTL